MKSQDRHKDKCRKIAKLIKSDAEWRISGYMSKYPFGTCFTATELSKQLDIPPSTTWQTLFKMHAKGLVKYSGDKLNGGRISTRRGTEVPYLFTCLGCLAHELKREGN